MQPRETKTITTPVGKHNVELKTYITGREKREISNIFLKGMKVTTDGSVASTIDVSVNQEANDKAWELVVVSIDGKKSNEISIIDTVLDMHVEDTNFVKAEVNKITADKEFEEKKTS